MHVLHMLHKAQMQLVKQGNKVLHVAQKLLIFKASMGDQEVLSHHCQLITQLLYSVHYKMLPFFIGTLFP